MINYLDHRFNVFKKTFTASSSSNMICRFSLSYIIVNSVFENVIFDFSLS